MNEAVQEMIRYSPKPRDQYFRRVGGNVYGPAGSKLLDKVEIWNLAYLSFDYDSFLEHPDPLFTTHVRRTAQSRLDGSGAAPNECPTKLVMSLLTLPAPRFTYLVLRNKPLLQSLPLFRAYGATWLQSIVERDKLCGWGAPHEEELDPESHEETRSALFKIYKMR